jgi:hypothetical protein
MTIVDVTPYAIATPEVFLNRGSQSTQVVTSGIYDAYFKSWAMREKKQWSCSSSTIHRTTERCWPSSLPQGEPYDR